MASDYSKILDTTPAGFFEELTTQAQAIGSFKQQEAKKEAQSVAQLEFEKKWKEFLANPRPFGKNSCNRCYGRGVEGTRSESDKTDKTGKKTVSVPVICTCALKGFQKSLRKTG